VFAFSHTSTCDDDYMVRVRAQVMTRDDSSGGWLPTHGGGMSVVGLRSKPSTASSQYLIYGQRVSDQAVSLCSLFIQETFKSVAVITQGLNKVSILSLLTTFCFAT
jgi:hypothetical protein